MTLWPIYVPSKGRPDCQTAKLLCEEGLAPTLVVEPQDFESYFETQEKLKANVNLAMLPENNKGIAYVRQFILNLNREKKATWFWMLDDDIKHFTLAQNGKNIKNPPLDTLLAAQELFESVKDLGQGALEYQQFSWSAKKPIKLNGYCDVCVAVHVERTRFINYRSIANLKEDRDFTLQVLAGGFNTARASMLGFAAPKNGSNKGGLYEEYQKSGKEAAASQKMCELWPGVCVPNTKPDGRKDVKINWSLFKTKVPLVSGS